MPRQANLKFTLDYIMLSWLYCQNEDTGQTLTIENHWQDPP